MEFDGPFLAGNIDYMLEIAEIVDSYELDLKTKYYLASAPASISSPYIEGVFRHYIESLEEDSIINYYPPKKLPKLAQTNEMMLEAEDRVREISLYLWLSFKFPNHFPDTHKAIQARGKLNKFIEMSLKEGELIKQCRRCGKRLDFTYRYPICEECYLKGRRFRYY
jgi:ATP-dependent RNA helicase SUPV3L1/SUV3